MWGKSNINWPGEQTCGGSSSLEIQPLLPAAKVPPAQAADSRQDPTLCDPLPEQRDISSPYIGAAQVHTGSSAPILFPVKA